MDVLLKDVLNGIGDETKRQNNGGAEKKS